MVFKLCSIETLQYFDKRARVAGRHEGKAPAELYVFTYLTY